jgi:hypothetical protein
MGLAACGPLFSVACDRVGKLCANIDLVSCDAQMEIAPPRVRSELVDCTSQATSCTDAVACFTTRGYYLPTVNGYR